MKKIVALFTYALMLGVSFKSYSQDDSVTEHSHFRFTSYYLSNAVYSGRKDSARVPYLKSSITYLHKSGFNASVGISTLVAAGSPISVDAVWLDAGYDFKLGEKVNGGINLTKTFYADASYSVSSEIKAEAGAYLGYDAGIVSINSSAYVMFSQSPDISTTLGLSHLFSMGESPLTIEPAFNVVFGTQNFYQAYYKNRKFANAGSGKGHSGIKHNLTTNSTVTFNQSHPFTVLDFEPSIDIKYEHDSWGLYFNPTYAIPVNPTSYIINNKTKTETLSNTFYFELGGHVNF
jgi:hypothetical protein